MFFSKVLDPPRINRGVPKELRFLLKGHRVMSSSIHAGELPHMMFPEDFITKSAEASRKKGGPKF
jgi:hypothetical protein